MPPISKANLPYYKDLSERIEWEGGRPYWKAHIRLRGSLAGHFDGKYRRITCRLEGTTRLIYAHVLKWFMDTGELPSHYLDHIDHNGDNNAGTNIRECTQKENNRNRRSFSGSSSQYKGVSWDRNCWRSSIWDGKRNVTLGRFDCEESAARAYDSASRALHGEFSFTNFPEEHNAF